MLEELRLACTVSLSCLRFLLLHCPTLTKLSITSACHLTNSLLQQILAVNPLSQLAELEISDGKCLDKETLHILINNCSNLR